MTLEKIKCKECGNVNYDDRFVATNEGTKICLWCYNEVTTYLRKGLISDEEVKEYMKLKKEVNELVTKNNLLLRKTCKHYKVGFREAIKELLEAEEAYCKQTLKKERSQVNLNQFLALQKDFEGFLSTVFRKLSEKDLKGITGDDKDGGRDINRINSLYLPNNDWLLGINR